MGSPFRREKWKESKMEKKIFDNPKKKRPLTRKNTRWIFLILYFFRNQKQNWIQKIIQNFKLKEFFFGQPRKKTILYCEIKFKQIDKKSSFATDSNFSSSKNKGEGVVFEEICLKNSLKTHWFKNQWLIKSNNSESFSNLGFTALQNIFFEIRNKNWI